MSGGSKVESCPFDLTRDFDGRDQPAGEIRLEVVNSRWAAFLVDDAQGSE